MSKLIKRIRKVDKNLESCLVMGSVWGEFSNIVENFKNVFVKITDKPYIRAKNVIARNTFEEMSLFPQINYVFIDYDCLSEIKSIEKVFTHYSPLIYIGHGEFLDKEQNRYLNSLSYEIIELRKDCQIWKRKR